MIYAAASIYIQYVGSMASPSTTQSKNADTQTSDDTLVYMLLAHETDRTHGGCVCQYSVP